MAEREGGADPSSGAERNPGNVVRRAPKVVQVSWETTHAVKQVGNTLFGSGGFEEGEAGPLGELTKGQRLVIDDEDVFISRRGSNQEDPEKRLRDRHSRPSQAWHRILQLNDKDVRGLQLFVRGETVVEYRGELEPKEQDAVGASMVYWIFNLVEGLLRPRKFRVGGSYAAKTEHNAERTPKDIDLEFWSYQEALAAAELLRDYKPPKTSTFPRLEYFLLNDKEEGVSVTVLAMGFRHGKESRPFTLLTIELNNENHRQGDRDFKKLPGKRYGRQPDRMHRHSLMAGSLERLSYTLAEGAQDTKQDEEFLKHIIGTMRDEEPQEVLEGVMSRFDRHMIANPPALAPDEDSGSDGEPEAIIDHPKRLGIAETKLKELLGLTQ